MLPLGDRGTKMIELDEAKDPVLWQTYVSWNQFVWLYVMSLIAALRGALLWQAALPGSALWVIEGCWACGRGARICATGCATRRRHSGC